MGIVVPTIVSCVILIITEISVSMRSKRQKLFEFKLAHLRTLLEELLIIENNLISFSEKIVDIKISYQENSDFDLVILKLKEVLTSANFIKMQCNSFFVRNIDINSSIDIDIDIRDLKYKIHRHINSLVDFSDDEEMYDTIEKIPNINEIDKKIISSIHKRYLIIEKHIIQELKNNPTINIR